MKIQRIIGLLLTTLVVFSCSENKVENKVENELKISLEKRIAESKADIGLSIIDSQSNEILSINGDSLYPMLSTVKIPIALAVLNKVEKHELSMDQKIVISREELLEDTWSPFRDSFPNGNVTISVEEALTWMVVHSDNNITDVMIRLVGGEAYIEKFIASKSIIVRNNEVAMHQDWDAQFINRASPNAYANLLKSFSEGHILNKENTQWLYQAMVKSTTGVNRLKGKLPDVEIAQRAGTSFTNDAGVTGSINNVGIIKLPDDRKIYIAVFIRNFSGFEKGEELIADIAKTVYDYYSKE